MFAVALLRTPPVAPDVTERLVAAALGLTAFEARQLLRDPAPVVVLRTPDAERARTVTEALKAGGLGVETVDLAAVPTLESMHELRGFRLEPDVLISLNQNGSTERLPWADITGFVRAMHRVLTTSTEVNRERKFALGRAVMTQGLLLTKTEKKVTEVQSEAREPVLYVFTKSSAPWFTTESRCRYEGLGPALKPARIENFNTLVRLLRERVPTAGFDDRLTRMRSLTAEEVDVRAHLIGRSFGL